MAMQEFPEIGLLCAFVMVLVTYNLTRMLERLYLFIVWPLRSLVLLVYGH